MIKVCNTCGKEYESNKFQPYIILCKTCRKKAKKDGKAVISPTPKKVVVKEEVVDDIEDTIKKDGLKNYMIRSKILEYLRMYKKLDMGFDTYIIEAPDLAGKEWRQRIIELKREGYNIKEKNDGLYLLDPEKINDNKTVV